MEGERGQDKLGGWDQHIYTTTYKTASQWAAAVWQRKFRSVFCDDLEQWDGVGWEGGPQGIRAIYVHIVDSFHCAADTNTYCKITIPQFKKLYDHLNKS